MEREFSPLWPGGPLYSGDPVGTDSLALADFARGRPGRLGCDFGCGSGILMLLLLWEDPSLTLTGAELRQQAASECESNLLQNRLTGRVFSGDYRTLPLSPGSQDFVIANPPYFRPGCGGVSPDPERAVMREESCSPAELCRAAFRLLREGGSLYLVHRTERLPELLTVLSNARLEPKRLRLLAPRPDAAPGLFLVEGRKNAQPGLKTEPTLFQRGPEGRETPEYRKICHWEA